MPSTTRKSLEDYRKSSDDFCSWEAIRDRFSDNKSRPRHCTQWLLPSECRYMDDRVAAWIQYWNSHENKDIQCGWNLLYIMSCCQQVTINCSCSGLSSWDCTANEETNSVPVSKNIVSWWTGSSPDVIEQLRLQMVIIFHCCRDWGGGISTACR